MADPPFEDGAFQDSATCELPPVATRPDGAPGGVTGVKVVADAVFEGALVSIKVMADTLYQYVVPGDRPPLAYVVWAFPVLKTIVDHVDPPFVDLSILYPVMSRPPRSAGGDQLRSIWEVEAALAMRFIGGPSIS